MFHHLTTSKNMRLFSLLSLSLLCLCSALCGCSNKGKTELIGEVTYGGEPVALGTITFTPKAEGYRAVQTIENGRFEIPSKFGVQPGEYNVLIEGYVSAPADDPDQVADKSFPDYATTITVEPQKSIVIDVPKE